MTPEEQEKKIEALELEVGVLSETVAALKESIDKLPAVKANPKLENDFAALRSEFDKLVGTVDKLPAVKANPKYDHKDDFELFNEVSTPIGKQLIQNRVILMPTKENPHHTQGEEFECEASQAVQHIKRGFATFVKTKAESDRQKAEAAKKDKK